MSAYLNLIKERYSVRKFSDRPVEPDILNTILEAGLTVPTACNNQPQRIKVIKEPADLEKIDQCTSFRFGTSLVLLICYDNTECWKRSFDGASSGEIDASIVTTQMMLATHDLGLGTCWVMYFDPEKVIQLFDLPKNIVPVAILPIGYPAKDAKPASGHNQTMPMDNMLLK